jgi:cathepsin L
MNFPRYFSFYLLLLVGVVCCFPEKPNIGMDDMEEPSRWFGLDEQWEQFKLDYDKRYDTLWEKQRRLIWETNLKYIEIHNQEFEQGLHSYTLGMNQFGDMTLKEFVANHLLDSKQINKAFDSQKDNPITGQYLSPLNLGPLPVSVDWRKQGYVTPVKDQGQCGSCWAFSTTGSLEGQYFRKTKKLVSFSEQQLVDCSKTDGNQGCNGGLMHNAFNYIKKKGIENSQDYPYKARDDRCSYNQSKVVTKIANEVKILKGNESKLQEATATQGPISVAIDASRSSFQLYKSGVYDEPACNPANLDHAVLVVGYGVDDQTKKPYWLVKNSWAEKWGESGYIRMSRNRRNQCGIASMASYPQL